MSLVTATPDTTLMATQPVQIVLPEPAEHRAEPVAATVLLTSWASTRTSFS